MKIEISQQAASSRPPRSNVLGVGVHGIDLANAVQIIIDAISQRGKGYVCLSGVHGIMEAHRDPELRSIFNNALLSAPDGMPTVWMGRLQGLRQMRRVFGPELMLQVCQASVAKGCTHFLYGGKPGVAEELKQNLEIMFPGLRIVGTYTPPFRNLSREEETQLAGTFSTLQPDITWIGLSTPKQERFMAQYLAKLDTRIMIGVGAAFDLHTGRMRDCPNWMKPLGLQWLHRLWQEPSRLWRRYLYCNSSFLFEVALQIAGIRRYELPAPPSVEFKKTSIAVRSSAPMDASAIPDLEQRAS